MPVVKSESNLFDVDANVLVNAVNTKGVSGSGVALGFKQRYPETQKLYEEACSNSWIKLGTPYIISVPDTETKYWTCPGLKYIICFPTKIAPSRQEKTKLSAISNGLDIIRNRCLDGLFPPNYVIALPKLGAGCGGLDEKPVIELIEKVLNEVPQKVILCI